MDHNRSTPSGIPIPAYFDHSTQGRAGEYPFKRGIYPEMYRQRLWTMRQYAGFSTAEESNARYRYLLGQGVSGLSVAFDLPTQIGYDSDDPMADGEVGRVGVAIDTIEDMERLFQGIDLEKVTTSMTINSTASILLALYVAVAKKHGADLSQIGGTIQNDILKEYAARGTYIFPPSPSMRLVTDVFDWCSKELPKWNTISISGYHIREAGSTAVQELAFTLANGIAYVQAAKDRGLDVDVFGSRLSFFFNAHNDFFEEIAKFRAARKLWSDIMKNRFGASKPKAMMCRFHTQTGGSTLAAKQISNNVARVTIQAMAAVLGGTQSLHTNGADEALSLPSENAARTALRTQQIIGHESGVADVVDPLAGSEYVEYLTEEMAERAVKLIEKIDDFGGAVEAISQGYYQSEIANSAYKYQKMVESGEKIIVGVNRFESENEEVNPNAFTFDTSTQERQIEGLTRFKNSREPNAVASLLAKISETAKTEDQNLFPPILEAVEFGVSVGEISHALRSCWGEYNG